MRLNINGSICLEELQLLLLKRRNIHESAWDTHFKSLVQFASLLYYQIVPQSCAAKAMFVTYFGKDMLMMSLMSTVWCFIIFKEIYTKIRRFELLPPFNNDRSSAARHLFFQFNYFDTDWGMGRDFLFPIKKCAYIYGCQKICWIWNVGRWLGKYDITFSWPEYG